MDTERQTHSGSMPYEAVIGLEVHAELDTRTKLFCGCSTAFGAPPNTQTCPVCLGLPGALPALNRAAFERALRLALALRCRINRPTVFDRKNYYYPDLPKNYQISQLYHNLGEDGRVDIIVEGEVKPVRIWNVHLEEDAGKLVHPEGGDRCTCVDLNRAGRPLLEIVSAPDMRASAEVEAYMKTLRNILLYTGVSDCKMQEGKLRFEPSVSLRPAGEEKLGARVEIKNVGSITAVVKAVDFEIARQSEALDRGEPLRQETRLWDERLNRTVSMRRKETSADYRYFPEPDLTPIEIDDTLLARVQAATPELPTDRRLRFRREFGLSDYDAAVITDERSVADYFEAALAGGETAPKDVANWVINDVLRVLKERQTGIADFPISPGRLGALAGLLAKGKINIGGAREVFAAMLESDKDPDTLIRERGLAQISDGDALARIVDAVLAAHPRSVADYKAGKKAAFNALIGPVMRETKGKANPQVVRELLQKRLGGQ